MNINTTFRLLVVAVSLYGCFSQKENWYREIESAKGFTFTLTFLRELVNVALEDCALLCVTTKACHSFFHDEETRLCRLIGGHLSVSEMVPSGGNAMSYYKSSAIIPDFGPPDFEKSLIPTVRFKAHSSTRMNGEEARAECDKYSGGNLVGHLLTVRTSAMYDEIISYLGTCEHHIDGYKTLPDATWVDWKGDALEYIRWDGGEPNNMVGTERCIYLKRSNRVHDISCTALDYYFLCQIDILEP